MVATVVTAMSGRQRDGSWLLLAYRLPREPSTPRIAVWRRLKRLGVAQLLDGLVGLPLDARNKEQLEWVADQVEEADGEASVWIGHLSSKRDELGIISSMSAVIAEEYRTVIAEAASAKQAGPSARRRILARLRRELRRIRYRDYFPPQEAEEARRAVDDLASLAEVSR
jgi:signal transduction histidine kinase